MSEKVDERRKSTGGRSSELPSDYLRMTEEVFTSNFSDALEKCGKSPPSQFSAGGDIYSDEVIVRMSLLQDKKLAGISVYASSDFDPKASAPTIETLLSLCVDALGQVFQGVFDWAEKEGQFSQLLEANLVDLDDLPLVWTPIEVEKRKTFVRVDKANPVLDQAADDWLAKNDPELKKQSQKEEQDAAGLFVLPTHKASPKK